MNFSTKGEKEKFCWVKFLLKSIFLNKVNRVFTFNRTVGHPLIDNFYKMLNPSGQKPGQK